MDNLESQTYEVFEKDPVKYAQYEKVRTCVEFFIVSMIIIRDNYLITWRTTYFSLFPLLRSVPCFTFLFYDSFATAVSHRRLSSSSNFC